MSESSKNKMHAVLNFINEYNAEYGAGDLRKVEYQIDRFRILLYGKTERRRLHIQIAEQKPCGEF